MFRDNSSGGLTLDTASEDFKKAQLQAGEDVSKERGPEKTNILVIISKCLFIVPMESSCHPLLSRLVQTDQSTATAGDDAKDTALCKGYIWSAHPIELTFEGT